MKIRDIFTALLAAVAVTGCAGGATSTGDHHHHDDNLQITGYSADFEVYAEATPLVVGEPCEVLTHVTRLPEFKPLEHGSVTISIIVGNQGVRQTLSTPLRNGIYKFELTPKTAGEAKMIFDIATSEGNYRVEADGLTVYSDHHDAWHAAAEAVATSSNGVAFTKEMSWTVDFSTAQVERRPMGQVIRTMARVQPSQGDVRAITAKNSGELIFASPDITDGKTVTAGQALFKIDASTMADNNLRVRFEEAKSEYERAKSEYERLSLLAKDKIVTESQLLAAKAEYDNAKAVYHSLREDFADGSNAVKAPISGYITGLYVSNGQYVEAGQTLATVAQNKNLFIKAEVSPSYFAVLSQINGANLRRPNSERILTLQELNGSVVSYGKAIDNDNPLIPIVFRVNNDADLLPGTFVEMFISAGSQQPVTVIPTRALIEEMGNYFVYVQLTPEYFEKREVKTGSTDGLYTEILNGLSEGERVVARGAILVKLAHSSGSLDAHSGHVH